MYALTSVTFNVVKELSKKQNIKEKTTATLRTNG